jgi:hypothetical protein
MPLKPAAAQATAVDLLAALKIARPDLAGESSAESMQKLGCMLAGCTGSVLSFLNYNTILTKFKACGLDELDLAAFEDLLSDGPLFCRGDARVDADPLKENLKGNRGGARANANPKLTKRRTTREYLAGYCHPSSFYDLRLTGKMTFETEKFVGKLMLQEMQAIARDNYATEDERKVVTNQHRLRLIGIPDPRPWNGRTRTWDVRSPPPAATRAPRSP